MARWATRSAAASSFSSRSHTRWPLAALLTSIDLRLLSIPIKLCCSGLLVPLSLRASPLEALQRGGGVSELRQGRRRLAHCRRVARGLREPGRHVSHALHMTRAAS